MYIVAIAWIYVVLMMSIVEQSFIAGIMTFLMYGVLPLLIILYLMRAAYRKPQRKPGVTPPLSPELNTMSSSMSPKPDSNNES
jgi:biotin transporter BioY